MDVTNAVDAGHAGSPDRVQLEHAAADGRVMFTYNVGDFFALHTQFRQEGRSHAGLILAVQQRYTVGEQLRRILRMNRERSSDDMRRFQTWLIAAFAGLGLVLSATGIHGVMHYAVAQRTHEMGIRIALGARGSAVLWLVIGEGLRLGLIGVAAGLVAALQLTGVMAHLLFEVSSTDPAIFAIVPVLLAMVAVLACYLPARRASRVDPVVALRSE
jgi:predicted lysophospholipase L1 biosynthesis ABC-type transport system permease subunit